MWLFMGDDGRLRAGWRFLCGVLLAFVAIALAELVAPNPEISLRRFDLVYRPVLALLLLLGFSFLLVALDQVETNPLAVLGLGLRRSQVRAEQHSADLGHPHERESPIRAEQHGADVGNPSANPMRDVFGGMLIGVGMIAVAVAVIAIGGNVSFTVTLNAHVIAPLLVVLVILITGALAEELMFRSYPFLQLEEATGRIGAVAITSVLFGAVHLGNPDVSPWAVVVTITVGVLLALARLRTRALWMPWGIHFGWNAALGLVFGLPVSGLNEFGIIVHGRARGALWLTGGKYGLEASALAEIVIVAGIVALMVLVPQRQLPRPSEVASLSISPESHEGNGESGMGAS